MGKVMSAMSRRATKPLREFNLETRVMKEITKERRPAAPWHESTAKLIQQSVQAQPEEMTRQLEERDDHLLDRLKKVYVQSVDPEPQTQPQIPENLDRPLPTDRTVLPDLDFGFYEPKSVPYGKITLRDAVDAISKHQQDPELWTPKKISYEFKLDTGLTDPKTTRVTSEMLQNLSLSAPDTLRELTSSKSEERNNVNKKS
ncbi:NDUFAF4-like [Homarus americanus]|uniref:NDUFAF4-like n=1 Tax=Homarus americanus TaxID=6706 RepID=A0A8J5JFM0_HOMAM|nr:NDUFAF4-like [Homarus americanus]